MKKLFMLFMLATAPVIGVFAQNALGPLTSSNEILWQLDSLIPAYHHPTVNVAKYSRDSLNIRKFSQDSLPAYSSDIVAQRLKEIGSPLPLAYNEDVQAFINLYTLQRRGQVERMLGLAHVYLPIFEEELDRAGMPMELKYLPVVESALNPHARSRVGATGLWQFMLGTGKMYDLDVTSYVDERRDPFKSTAAAIKYLGNMYKTYNDWLLVVAAYNCGPGNVNKAIARSGGKRTFWEIQEFLPKETRSYVPALIAATYVFNYSHEHNLFPRMIDFSFNQDTVHITRQLMSLKHFADITHTDFFVLKDLNPELKTDFIPYSPEPYVLRVPMKTGQFFASFRDSIMLLATKLNLDSAKVVYTDTKLSPLTNKPYEAELSEHPTYATSAAATATGTDGKKVVYHKVRKGEVVGQIAAKYHVSAKDLAKWNGLRNYAIKAGQNLKVYVKGSPNSGVSTPKVEPEPQIAAKIAEPAKAEPAKVEPVKAEPKKVIAEADPAAKYHVVKYGDTLWQIASAYDGLTVEKLKSLNDLNGNSLAIGQKLRVE
ncbi:MAG: transglycosylase SLT domain-containing protein [Bacteroidetes bacterium]|nr:transglycosylase SLT domain-containing protein [Bacteroidota bacterium]